MKINCNITKCILANSLQYPPVLLRINGVKSILIFFQRNVNYPYYEKNDNVADAIGL